MQIEWFGENWGAPLCSDTKQVPTPVGEPCILCPKLIEEKDKGIIMDSLETIGGFRRPVHLDCFLLNIGARND